MITIPTMTNKAHIWLQGGLGNQMFQYLFGLFFEKSMKIPVTYFWLSKPLFASRSTSSRELDLLKFPKVDKSRISVIRSIRKSPNFDSISRGIAGCGSSSFLLVENLTRDNHHDIPSPTTNLFMKGYWQNIDYPQKLFSSLSSIFEWPELPNHKMTPLLDSLSSPSSIAIHIRRGDYVDDDKTNRFHGACSKTYYRQAVQQISSIVPNPKFYIFSDNPSWIDRNIEDIVPKNASCINVSSLGFSSFEELQLMTYTSHLIMSNSSYSWWGGVIPRRNGEDKVNIIAPFPWFRQSKKTPTMKKDWNLLHIDSGLRTYPEHLINQNYSLEKIFDKLT